MHAKEQVRAVLSALDPDAKKLTSYAAVWVTPTDRALGFVLDVADEDRQDMAKMLREHADAIESGFPHSD